MLRLSKSKEFEAAFKRFCPKIENFGCLSQFIHQIKKHRYNLTLQKVQQLEFKPSEELNGPKQENNRQLHSFLHG